MNNEKKMLVSTILPVYNGARYICQAIESILAQEYEPMEIIVVDDGSIDDTRSAVQRFGSRVNYVYQENAGIAVTMNHGVNLARGSLFAFLDSDDYWLPGKTNRQWAALCQDPSLDMVFGNVQQFYSPELEEELRKKYSIPPGPVPGRNSGSMLIKRASFFRVGLFDPQYKKGIFNDWYIRAVENGLRQEVLPDVVYMRRIHDANHGILAKAHYGDYARMLKAALDRKRQSAKGEQHGQETKN
jgi:glycosyltransferase involved in cell wall biosynthesis